MHCIITLDSEMTCDCTRSNNRPGVATEFNSHCETAEFATEVCKRSQVTHEGNHLTCNATVDMLLATSGVARPNKTLHFDRWQEPAVLLQAGGGLLRQVSSRLYDDGDGRAAGSRALAACGG